MPLIFRQRDIIDLYARLFFCVQMRNKLSPFRQKFRRSYFCGDAANGEISSTSDFRLSAASYGGFAPVRKRALAQEYHQLRFR